MVYGIYTGVWIDWSKGKVLGSTITLSSNHGNLLLAFIATFVTILSVRLWRIICFALHQTLASPGRHDGLYYQRQHILRNTTSPLDAAWLFVHQSWHWRGIATKSVARTVPLVIAGALYVAAFGVLAVFSSQISDAASHFRLLSPTDCGRALPATVKPEEISAWVSYANLRASIYSRQCYQNTSSSSGSCGNLPVAKLQWTNGTTECPFASNVCMNTTSFRMDSGQLDSHEHLGINEPPENRIRYRRETVCSPLMAESPFTEYVESDDTGSFSSSDRSLVKYLYGPTNASEYTYIYDTFSVNGGTGFMTWAGYCQAASLFNAWQPIDELEADDRDVTIFFVTPNMMRYQEPTEDPVFRATEEVDTGSGIIYKATRWVSPIACADRHQFCNAMNDECTPLQGSLQASETAADGGALGLNDDQRAAVKRIGYGLLTSTFAHLIWGRATNFLRISEKAGYTLLRPVPDNQWEMEMAALFSDVMSSLQHEVLEYPTVLSGSVDLGPKYKPWEHVNNGSSAAPRNSSEELRARAHEQQCYKQRTRATEGTLNFSVLGLALLLGFGCLMLTVSWTIEPAVAAIQKRTGLGREKAASWERDASLQVMRAAFEARGAGVWRGTMADFPVTETGDVFEYDGHALDLMKGDPFLRGSDDTRTTLGNQSPPLTEPTREAIPQDHVQSWVPEPSPVSPVSRSSHSVPRKALPSERFY